jgi:hypothetical protein
MKFVYKNKKNFLNQIKNKLFLIQIKKNTYSLSSYKKKKYFKFFNFNNKIYKIAKFYLYIR